MMDVSALKDPEKVMHFFQPENQAVPDELDGNHVVSSKENNEVSEISTHKHPY